MKKYPIDTEIAVETSTAGKYVAHLLRDHGLHVHLANSKELKLIWKSKKKTDKNDARILARLLRTGDLPESYLPTLGTIPVYDERCSASGNLVMSPISEYTPRAA